MQQVIDVINERIREIGIKQTVVAQRAEMTDDILGKSLGGKRKLKADELVNICRVLGLDIQDFEQVNKSA